MEVGGGYQQHAEHAVSAVDQGEALFFGQDHRGDAGRGQRLGGVHGGTGGVADRAFAHQGQGRVGERGKIARATQRTIFTDDRGDARVEDGRVGGCHDGPYAGAAGGQGGESVEHQRADHLARNLGPGGRGMGADQ